MKFELSEALPVLESTPKVLTTWLEGLPEEWVSRNEGGDSWSPYDIVGHLIHGELTDWIPRMQLILSDTADKTFRPFDRFAQFRESRGKPLGELLQTFRDLRVQNLEVLRAARLGGAELEREGRHPELGPASLRQLLSAWVVHDLNHLHQVARCMAWQYKGEVGPWRAYLGVLKP